jgi:hypothetical protein
MIKPTAGAFQHEDHEDDDDDSKPRHRRAASSSSMGSMPPDTDFDFDNLEDPQDDEDDGIPAPDGEASEHEIEVVGVVCFQSQAASHSTADFSSAGQETQKAVRPAIEI